MKTPFDRRSRGHVPLDLDTLNELAGFVSDKATARVAAVWLSRTAKSRPKYQEKKEVPKSNGSGTTTVYQYGPRQVANRHKEKADRIETLRGRIGDLRKQIKKDLEAGL